MSIVKPLAVAGARYSSAETRQHRLPEGHVWRVISPLGKKTVWTCVPSPLTGPTGPITTG